MKIKIMIVIVSFVLILAAVAVTTIFILNRETSEPQIEIKLPETKEKNAETEDAAGEPENADLTADLKISKIEIIPTKNTPDGIDVDTEFIVKTDMPSNIAELMKCITVKSGESYQLRESGTECEYLMSLDSVLNYDSIYRIEFKEEDERPLSFAFQTIENFKVIGAIPRNEAYDIPLNSGIEITFNERIDGEFKDYFSITPYAAGKFENVGNTYIFISEGFMPNTRYEITVKKGLKSAENNKTLEEDYTVSFWTQWGNAPDSVSMRGDVYETFLPDDEIFVEICAVGVFLEKSYTAEIYGFNGYEEFLNAETLFKDHDKIPDFLSGKTCINSIKTELFIVEGGNNYYAPNSYVMLNQTLPNGWYIIKITAEHENKKYDLYKFIQVSPLSVYSASIAGEMLFWINDVSAGKPAAGAEITASSGNVKAVAGNDGLAVMDTAVNKNVSVTIKYADYPAFVYFTQAYAPAAIDPRNRYYNYLYTDRKAYRPTDTIDLFGVVRERYGDVKITANDKITLKIGNMIEIPVLLDQYGSFNAKIPITDMKGYLYIELCFNGEVINSSYVNIVDYDNAKYMIDAKTDRISYRPGDGVEIAVTVETYDGTAAPGVEIIRNGGEIAGVTDANGSAAVKETGEGYAWGSGWQPYTRSFYYDIGKTENKIQYISVPYVYIPSDIMLEYNIISGGGIDFTSNFIDRAAIEDYVGESWYNSYYMQPDLYRADPADIDFTFEIHKYETIRTKTGEKYDYINKVNVPIYQYNTNDTVYGTYNYKTLNGKVSVKGLPVSDDLYICYYANVQYKDTDGNQININYIWYDGNYRYYYFQSSIKNYYFNLYDQDNKDIYRLGLNETGYIKLADYNSEIQNITNGQILTVLCQAKNKIISKNIGSPDGTPVTFTKDCIYNARVVGAYFDGKNIYPINYGREIYYDYAEKTLDFDISFDKDSYIPGDEVAAEIKVTDKKGNPKKTLVNISVVDESVFAEYENNANMPDQYYSSVYGYIEYNCYASYTQHEFLNGGGAERGDGGSGDYMMRKDFTDNPAFVSIETDDSGVARITFKLAEKITSWRVTAHGVTGDDYVGNTKKNIVSSLPFAIDLVMNNEYIAGDDASFIVKPQGTEYKQNQTEINYSAEILSGGKVITSGKEVNKGSFDFNAGKLPEGDYIIRVTAEISANGEKYGDGMEKPFGVVKSGVLLSLNARDIVSGENPAIRKYDIKTSPVRVTMSNYDMAFIMQTLYSCVNDSSKRTDYLAANVFSRKFSSSIYNKTLLKISPSDYNGIDFGDFYGVRSELTYGDSDLLYMARFYACFPEAVRNDHEKNNLREYIYNNCRLYIDNKKGLKNMTPEFEYDEYIELDRAAGYLTLASAGEPVLLEIYEQVNRIYNSENQNQFTESYQSHMRALYYAAALCALGDDTRAAELIGRYPVSENLYNNAQNQATKYLWKESINTMTLYINTRLDPDAALKYLKEKEPNIYVSDVCEKINFVRNFTFKGGARSEIEYTFDGVTQKKVFENYDMTELTLTKEQFEALNIKQISGNTAVNSYFYGSPENLNANKNEIYLERQILSRAQFLEQYKDENYSDKKLDGDLYYIVFKLKIPAGTAKDYYTICDRLPSNLRYLTNGAPFNINAGANHFYISNPEKQFVNICVYAKSNQEITVAYNAVRISDSDAVTEKAYISRNYDVDGIWGASK